MNLLLPVRSYSVPCLSLDLLHPKNIVVAVRISVWSHSILISPVGLRGSANVGLAAEISFLSHPQAEI